MDKVIIDGVDVSGCNFYIQDYQRANNIKGKYEHCKDVCDLNGDNYFYCKMNKDCYYKQLKRLEQENERLKAELRPLEDSYFNGLSSIEIAELAKKSIRITAENRKLEYALQEIRDIAKEHIVCADCNFEGTDKCDARMCTHFYLNDFSNNILDKINEVIGAE